MKINKQLFEDVLSGKLKGTFVLRNKWKIPSKNLCYNSHEYAKTHPYCLLGTSENLTYKENGEYCLYGDEYELDIINFIQEIDMKENNSTIEIPDGKIVDWDESKKQNKIVLIDKQLTYEDVCKKLFKDDHYCIGWEGYPVKCCSAIYNANNAITEHQLDCILAKNKFWIFCRILWG